jgi:AcrR family transcriptional regulator
MPRQADPHLQERILEAAYRLWSRGGEKALTMRAVARAAKTTTPTVYQHFRDKREVLRHLRRRAQQDLYSAVRPARSLAEFCRTALEFALHHPQEYRLMAAGWIARFDAREPTPALDLLERRLAERLGGSPAQHRRLALSLAALVHGVIMAMLEGGGRNGVAAEMRHACLDGCEMLVGDARAYRGAFRR